MRARTFVILLLCVLFSGLFTVAATEKAVSLVDRTQVRSGWQYVVDDIEQTVKNTRKRYPDLQEELAKATRQQVSVGDTLQFYTLSTVDNTFEKIKAVCRKKSARTYIFAGVEAWENGKIQQGGVDNFYRAFEEETPQSSYNPDQGIRDILESYIGTPPNKSGDNYVYILIYDIEDDYNPSEGKSVYTAGYFLPYDQSNGSYSNQKDLLYIDCDPGDPTSTVTASVVAHEFQHLLHYGMDANESSQNGVWVNEGASIYSEVLCGYGLRNPTPYLQHPERSLNVFSYESLSQIDYAKVGLWFYYIAEKFGADLVSKIVRDPLHGVEGVRSALEDHNVDLSFEQIYTRFVLANLVNDVDLNDNGYYGYNTLAFSMLPRVKKTHKSYPVSDQLNHVLEYASHYFRFDARDSTAILHTASFSGHDVKMQVYISGDNKIDVIELDNDGLGQYALSAIEKATDALYFIASGLNATSTFSYSVSSRIEDLNAPQITDGPFESLPSGNSVTIFWETDELANSIVEYGINENYGSRIQNDSLTVSHRMLLNDLQPNTTYFYRVGSTDSKGNGPTFSAGFRFTTASMKQHVVAEVQQAHSYGYQGRNLIKDASGELLFAYHEFVGDRRFIFFTSSQDQGQTWSSAVAIDTTLYYGGMPSMSMGSDDRLHVAWHAQEESAEDAFKIYYSYSDDNGQNWSRPQVISNAFTGNDQLYPAIAIDPQNQPHIVWNTALYSDQFKGDVYHAFSVDGGITWQTDKEISDSEFHRCFVPTIDFNSEGRAYVLYSDGIFQDRSLNIYSIHSRNYSEWSSSAQITRSGVLYDGMASFVLDAFDRLHLVYADNYIPGDIRIMYKRLESNTWQPGEPIAQSYTNGNLNYPNIASDIEGNLYVVYEDEQGNSSLGKAIHKEAVDDRRRALRKVGADQSDIFLTLFKHDTWQPPLNLSSDQPVSAFPELPLLVDSDQLDAVFINTLNASSHQIQHVNINTAGAVYDTPPRVVSVFPEEGDTNLPYSRQTLEITVQFDQRMAADSFVPEHVIVEGAASGLIKGDLTYKNSQRLMRFKPAEDIEPNDEISVRLTGLLSNVTSMSLDGDADGIAEGTPDDDYTWSFFTSGPDETPPLFTLGVLQNPVLSAYMDIYVIASELLLEVPQLKVNDKVVALQTINAEKSIYKGDYKLAQSQIIQLLASGKDLFGNAGNASKNFSAQLLQQHLEGWVESVDKHLHLYLPQNSLEQDTWITILKEKKDDQAPVYKIGPAALELQNGMEINYYMTDSDRFSATFERQRNDGSWEPISSRQENQVVYASVNRLGSYRVVRSEKSLPQSFELLHNYPNPFSLQERHTTLGYRLPEKSRVEIVIYDVLGRHVKTLVNRVDDAGVYRVSWDGTDKTTRQVPSGVYFYQFKTPHKILTHKMIVLH